MGGSVWSRVSCGVRRLSCTYSLFGVVVVRVGFGNVDQLLYFNLG